MGSQRIWYGKYEVGTGVVSWTVMASIFLYATWLARARMMADALMSKCAALSL
ncbi:hypothetical protein D3C71_1848530 [compost metagenome]